jgi:hypothetical protein
LVQVRLQAWQWPLLNLRLRECQLRDLLLRHLQLGLLMLQHVLKLHQELQF